MTGLRLIAEGQLGEHPERARRSLQDARDALARAPLTEDARTAHESLLTAIAALLAVATDAPDREALLDAAGTPPDGTRLAKWLYLAAMGCDRVGATAPALRLARASVGRLPDDDAAGQWIGWSQASEQHYLLAFKAGSLDEALQVVTDQIARHRARNPEAPEHLPWLVVAVVRRARALAMLQQPADEECALLLRVCRDGGPDAVPVIARGWGGDALREHASRCDARGEREAALETGRWAMALLAGAPPENAGYLAGPGAVACYQQSVRWADEGRNHDVLTAAEQGLRHCSAAPDNAAFQRMRVFLYVQRAMAFEALERYEDALAVYDDASRSAQALGTQAPLFDLRYRSTFALGRLGRLEEASTILDGVLAWWATAAPEERAAGPSLRGNCLLRRAWLRWRLDDDRAAPEDGVTEALAELAGPDGTPSTVDAWGAWTDRALYRLGAGDPAAAAEAVEAACRALRQDDGLKPARARRMEGHARLIRSAAWEALGRAASAAEEREAATVLLGDEPISALLSDLAFATGKR